MGFAWPFRQDSVLRSFDRADEPVTCRRWLDLGSLRMSRLKLAFFVFAAGLLLGASVLTPAHAYVFEQGTGSPTTGTTLVGGLSATQEFQAFNGNHVASPSVLSDLDVELAVGSTTGSLVVTLWTGTSGGPTSQIATIDTVSLLSLNHTLGNNTKGILNIFNITSQPGTTGLSTSGSAFYWIGFQLSSTAPSHGTPLTLEDTGTSTLLASYAGTPGSGTLTSAAAVEICADNGNASNISVCNPSSYGLAVDNNNAPEPASLAILGSALAGLGVIRRQRAKRARKA
jgi:hypothetical protein